MIHHCAMQCNSAWVDSAQCNTMWYNVTQFNVTVCFNFVGFSGQTKTPFLLHIFVFPEPSKHLIHAVSFWPLKRHTWPFQKQAFSVLCSAKKWSHTKDKIKPGFHILFLFSYLLIFLKHLRHLIVKQFKGAQDWQWRVVQCVITAANWMCFTLSAGRLPQQWAESSAVSIGIIQVRFLMKNLHNPS